MADIGWLPGFHGTPLMKVLIILFYDKVTISVVPVEYSLDRTACLMNSIIILTVAYLRVLLNEFWSPRAHQTTPNTPFSIVSECGQR